MTIEKKEYLRLKKLDESFGRLFAYFNYLQEIGEARKEIKEKETIDQKELFKKLEL